MSRPTILRSVAAAAVAAATVITLQAVPAGAVGYAGTAPVSAPAGSFPSTASSGTVTGTAPLTLSSSTMSLTVPGGALPPGTQVTVLNGDPAQLQSLLPSGESFVVGYAIGWVAPDGSTPNATSPLTFTITDQRITGTENAFESTATGLTPTGASLSAGHAGFTFSTDPGFVLANAVSTPIGPGNTGGGAAADTGTGGVLLPAGLVAAAAGALAATAVQRRRKAAGTAR